MVITPLRNDLDTAMFRIYLNLFGRSAQTRMAFFRNEVHAFYADILEYRILFIPHFLPDLHAPYFPDRFIPNIAEQNGFPGAQAGEHITPAIHIQMILDTIAHTAQIRAPRMCFYVLPQAQFARDGPAAFRRHVKRSAKLFTPPPGKYSVAVKYKLILLREGEQVHYFVLIGLHQRRHDTDFAELIQTISFDQHAQSLIAFFGITLHIDQFILYLRMTAVILYIQGDFP
jgi:hypothetical protein